MGQAPFLETTKTNESKRATRRRLKTFVIVTFLIGVPVWYLSLGFDKHYFGSVDDRLWIRLTSEEFEANGARNWILRDGELYLYDKTIRTWPFVRALIHQEEWNDEQIAELKLANPDLLSYLPEPNSPDGGIIWLRRRWAKDLE